MSIDPAALDPYREAMGSDADSFVVDLIDTFLSTTQEHIAALYTSAPLGDAKLFTRSAHTLKSNCAIFGAQALATMCLKLEREGKTDDLLSIHEKHIPAEWKFASRFAQFPESIRQTADLDGLLPVHTGATEYEFNTAI